MIAAMRQTTNVALNCIATVLRPTGNNDGYGTAVTTPQVIHSNIACRVQQIIRTPRTEQSTSELQEYATTMLIFNWGTDVRSGDSVQVINDKGLVDTFIVDSPYDNTVDAPTSNYYCYKES